MRVQRWRSSSYGGHHQALLDQALLDSDFGYGDGDGEKTSTCTRRQWGKVDMSHTSPPNHESRDEQTQGHLTSF
jgi:hypothetical protein